ncbi:MAG: hypothetical protein GDA49_12195 [Rhodospirillales bacterium]|nr:hypothetical protein [Rhodospirillales bacterium]
MTDVGDAVSSVDLADERDQVTVDPLPAMGRPHGNRLDPDHRAVDQIDTRGIKARHLAVYGADGLVIQPCDDDLLVQLPDGIGEVRAKGVVQNGRLKEVRTLRDVKILDLSDEREIGIQIAGCGGARGRQKPDCGSGRSGSGTRCSILSRNGDDYHRIGAGGFGRLGGTTNGAGTQRAADPRMVGISTIASRRWRRGSSTKATAPWQSISTQAK